MLESGQRTEGAVVTSLRLRVAVAVLALTAAIATAGAAAAQPSRDAAVTTVNVTMTEFKFTLSKTSVKHGTVVFVLHNAGSLVHDFQIAGKKSALVNAGKTLSLRMTIAKAGRYSYICTIPGHAAAGMKGTLRVK